MEYDRVRTDVWPVSRWVKTEKSAPRSSFAWLTGMEKLSQSPAGEMDFASMPFSANQALTAATLSGDGATNFSTC